MRADYPVRKSPRLKEYNYNENGAYFVTFCTKERRCTLGSIAVGAVALDGPQLQLTQQGKIVEKVILHSNEVYSHISVDAYIIMPNHVHLLVTIAGDGPSGSPWPGPYGCPSQICGNRKTIGKPGSGREYLAAILP